MTPRKRTSRTVRVLATWVAVPLGLGSTLAALAGGTASASVNHHTAVRAGAAIASHPTADHSTRPPAGFVPPLPHGVHYDPSASRGHGPGAQRPPALSQLAGLSPSKIAGEKTLLADERARIGRHDASLQGASGLATARTPQTYTNIYSISCWSTTGCLAVGETYFYGTDESYAAKWNGSSWSSASGKQFSQNGDVDEQYLTAVSCFSAHECLASGYATILSDSDKIPFERWTGSSWKLYSAAVGAEDADVEAVSCFSATFCMAVGRVNDSPLAIEFTGGSGYSLQSVSSPGGTAYLNGVSCPTLTECFAVGSYEDEDDAYITEYDGSWTNLSGFPSPGVDENVLTAVSCRSAASCLAVGYQYGEEVEIPLTENIRLSPGLTVTQAGSNDSFTAYEELWGVSCTPSDCVAAGYGANNDAYASGFAETWNGSKWVTDRVQAPAPLSYTDLDTVACMSATKCVVGGDYDAQSTLFTDLPVVESLTSHGFEVSNFPKQFTPYAYFEAIVCSSHTYCVADGEIYTGDLYLPLVEVWHGKGWTSLVAPVGLYGAWLGGITCTSTSFCLLTGGSEFEYYDEGPLALEFNQKSFRVLTEKPSGLVAYYAYWWAASCWSSTSCLLVGSSEDSPIAGTLNGSTISASPMFQLYDDDTYPYAVSCTSKKHCDSLVEYYHENGEYSAIETWNGGTWAVTEKSFPLGGSEDTELSGLQCFSSTSCIADGEAYVSKWEAVVDVLKGSTWTTRVLPAPSGMESSGLYGINCSSVTSCYAGGWAYSSGAGDEVAMAMELNGTTWRTKFLSSSFGELYAGACASSSLCFQAGEDSPTGDNTQRLLVEDKGGVWSYIER